MIEDKSQQKTMRACFYNKYGGAAMSQIGDLPIPQLSHSNEVIVRVHAAGLNPFDYKRRSGALKAVLQDKWPVIIGSDLSGVVIEVGCSVTRFQLGDQVFGCLPLNQSGTFAEYVVASEDILARKPHNLTHVEAASIPTAALASLQCLKKIHLYKGDKLFITGGSGGVGTVAIQMAKHVFKTSVIATTAKGSKASKVKQLGADYVVDYQESKFQNEFRDFDCAMDCTGEARKCMDIVKNEGSIVTLADTPSKKSLAGLEYLGLSVGYCTGVILNCMSNSATRKARLKGIEYNYHVVHPEGKMLDEIASFYSEGKLRPIIDRQYSLGEFDDALLYLESGKAIGKVVLQII